MQEKNQSTPYNLSKTFISKTLGTIKNFFKIPVIGVFLLNSCKPNNHINSMNFSLEFNTSHNQFYIADKHPNGNTAENFWTDEAYNSHLAVAEDIIGVGMESYGKAKCQLRISKLKPPILEFDEYDHIVEAGLQINSGTLQILNCPSWNVEFETDIPIGQYGVRVSSKGLSGITSDDYDLDNDDSYVIEIWPDSVFKKKVLKQSHF